MKRLLSLCPALLLILSCGGSEGDLPSYHFAKCDLYPIFEHKVSEGLAWSPDGEMIVMAHDDNLWWLPPSGGKATRLTDMEGYKSFPDWGAVNGTDKLVFINRVITGYDVEKRTSTTTDAICTFAPGGGEPVSIKSFTEWLSYTSWSHDGKRIVFIKRGGASFDIREIYTIPVSGGEETRIATEYLPVSAKASPVEALFFYVESIGDIYILCSVNIDGGRPNRIKIFPEDDYADVADIDVSADGSTIACIAIPKATNAWNIFTIPAGGGDEIMLTEFDNPGIRLENLAWSHDGKRIAIALSVPVAGIGVTGKRLSGVYIAELKL